MPATREQVDALIALAGSPTGMGTGPDKLDGRPNNLALMKWYQKQAAWADHKIDRLEKLSGIKATCKPGCSSCCRNMIWSTRVELDIIKAYLQKADMHEVRAVYDRSVRSARVIIEAFGSATVARNTFNSQEMREKYRSMDIMCPLLDENGLCTVYPVRPSNCWAFRSYGEVHECAESLAPPLAIHYKELEQAIVVDNLYQARPPKNETTLLPEALKQALADML